MKLLGTFIALKAVEGLTCNVCGGVRGSDGKPYGVSDDACFENLSERHQVECPAESKFCVDDIEVDWFTDGEQLVTIRRGCGEATADDGCYENETENKQYRWKDCKQSCSSNTCNNDMSVGDKIVDDKIKDLSCYRCKWREEDDGTVLGDPECENEKGGQTGECPNYGMAGCYAAASHHYLNESGDLKKHIYKGCSAWADRQAPQTYSYVFQEQEYHVSKLACIENNCNEKYYQPEEVISCHSCTATYDTAKDEMIYGDPKCLHEADETPVRPCSKDAIGCTTEIMTDWFTKGDQTSTIRRGCIEEESPKECTHGFSERIMFHDCYDDCVSSRCNDELAVAEKFEDGKQDSCFTCYYKQEDDGTTSGNENCLNDPGARWGNSKASGKECPRWANVGCFTGAAEHDFEGWKLEVYKGCSSFKVDGVMEYEDTLEDGYAYSTTKETCTGKDCNKGHTTPKHPGQSGSASAIFASAFAFFTFVLNL